MLNDFHFLRPWWLSAMIPILFLIVYLYRGFFQKPHWQSICDDHLLPHLLMSEKKSCWPFILLSLSLLSLTIALSGPTWRYEMQDMYQSLAARVIVLDLSEAMAVQDIKPSRLERAKYKLLDILRSALDGAVGLIVFTSEPYVVSPLTQDSQTIANMVPNLSLDIMPVQGSKITRALKQAENLLEQSAGRSKEILLMTVSEPTEGTFQFANYLASQGITLSVLGMGTSIGGPMPIKSFQQNKIIMSHLPEMALKRLASEGQGRYHRFTNDASDLESLLDSDKTKAVDNARLVQRQTQQWKDEGRYFIFPVLLFALLAFRQGWLEEI